MSPTTLATVAHTVVMVLALVGVTVLAITGDAPDGLVAAVYGAVVGYSTGAVIRRAQ